MAGIMLCLLFATGLCMTCDGEGGQLLVVCARTSTTKSSPTAAVLMASILSQWSPYHFFGGRFLQVSDRPQTTHAFPGPTDSDGNQGVSRAGFSSFAVRERRHPVGVLQRSHRVSDRDVWGGSVIGGSEKVGADRGIRRSPGR